MLWMYHTYGVPLLGNVGDSKALAEVVKRWARPVRNSSTKELLVVRFTMKNKLKSCFKIVKLTVFYFNICIECREG